MRDDWERVDRMSVKVVLAQHRDILGRKYIAELRIDFGLGRPLHWGTVGRAWTPEGAARMGEMWLEKLRRRKAEAEAVELRVKAYKQEKERGRK